MCAHAHLTRQARGHLCAQTSIHTNEQARAHTHTHNLLEKPARTSSYTDSHTHRHARTHAHRYRHNLAGFGLLIYAFSPFFKLKSSPQNHQIVLKTTCAQAYTGTSADTFARKQRAHTQRKARTEISANPSQHSKVQRRQSDTVQDLRGDILSIVFFTCVFPFSRKIASCHNFLSPDTFLT